MFGSLLLAETCSFSSFLTTCEETLAFLLGLLVDSDSSLLPKNRLFMSFPGADSSSSALAAARPLFFCTLGAMQLVRPPTVINVILSPLGRVVAESFFPFPHR